MTPPCQGVKEDRVPLPARGSRSLPILLALFFLPFPVALWGAVPPLEADILSETGEQRGKALVYQNYVEILDTGGAMQGAIGVVMVQGKIRLFLIRSDAVKTLIGWAENHRLYNGQNHLVGYYYWTPTWSYVYDQGLKKVGEAQCLAYPGVCAAGIAGCLLGLL